MMRVRKCVIFEMPMIRIHDTKFLSTIFGHVHIRRLERHFKVLIGFSTQFHYM